MKVLGIDPGTIKMGIGFIEGDSKRFKTCSYTTFYLKKSKSVHARLFDIYNEVSDFISTHKPDVLALEDVFYGVNFKSAIRIGEARAAVILAAQKNGLDVIEYLPTKVKNSVCGSGRASKVQVQNMVKNILFLSDLPQSDAADALAVAICHFNTLKYSRG